MKNNIPENAILKDYIKTLNYFTEQLAEIEKENIISIFLQGSFARGEATDNSDLDIWCVFKTLNTETLSKISIITENLPINYNQLELNAQCITLDEFNSGHFSNFFSYAILYFEAVLIWGEDIITKPAQDEDMEKTYKQIVAEVLLGIRHYITVNEPFEKLTYQKIKTWILKPLMFALRLERYLYTRQYPITIKDLINAYDTPPKSVAYFMNKEKWDIDIQNNRKTTLYCLNDEVESLLGIVGRCE